MGINTLTLNGFYCKLKETCPFIKAWDLKCRGESESFYYTVEAQAMCFQEALTGLAKSTMLESVYYVVLTHTLPYTFYVDATAQI